MTRDQAMAAIDAAAEAHMVQLFSALAASVRENDSAGAVHFEAGVMVMKVAHARAVAVVEKIFSA